MRVRTEVIIPLRALAAEVEQMRRHDRLPDALSRDMQQRRYGGGKSDRGAGHQDRD